MVKIMMRIRARARSGLKTRLYVPSFLLVSLGHQSSLPFLTSSNESMSSLFFLHYFLITLPLLPAAHLSNPSFDAPYLLRHYFRA
jgi:hypothetical protein